MVLTELLLDVTGIGKSKMAAYKLVDEIKEQYQWLTLNLRYGKK